MSSRTRSHLLRRQLHRDTSQMQQAMGAIGGYCHFADLMACDRLIRGFANIGVWDRFLDAGAFIPHGNGVDHLKSMAAKIKSPQGVSRNLTLFNFVNGDGSRLGLTGVQASGNRYADTGVLVTRITWSDAHLSCYCVGSAGALGAISGAGAGGGQIRILPNYPGGSTYWGLDHNQTLVTDSNYAGSPGLFLATRTGTTSTMVKARSTGILSTSATVSSAGATSSNINVFRGTTAEYYGGTLGFYSAGSAIAPESWGPFTRNLQNFMSRFGRAA